jgi:hypothetical protein
VLEHGDQENNMSKALVTSLASWSANIVSCVITHPIDLIRTRVYLKFYNKEESQQYKGLSDAIV